MTVVQKKGYFLKSVHSPATPFGPSPLESLPILYLLSSSCCSNNEFLRSSRWQKSCGYDGATLLPITPPCHAAPVVPLVRNDDMLPAPYCSPMMRYVAKMEKYWPRASSGWWPRHGCGGFPSSYGTDDELDYHFPDTRWYKLATYPEWLGACCEMKLLGFPDRAILLIRKFALYNY